MKNDTFKATVTTAYGQTLKTPLKISGSYEVFETVEEVREAYRKPNEFDEFVIGAANAASKASAIAAERTKQLDDAGIKAPKLGEDREATIRHIMRGLVAAGKSEEEARRIAEPLVP